LIPLDHRNALEPLSQNARGEKTGNAASNHNRMITTPLEFHAEPPEDPIHTNGRPLA
jgi:hypothetical protein